MKTPDPPARRAYRGGGRAFNASERAVLRDPADAVLATPTELSRLASLGLIVVAYRGHQKGHKPTAYEVTEKGRQLCDLD